MVNGIAKLVAVIYLYSANFISGREFVKKIDGIVSDDHLTSLPSKCREAFDLLHEQLALCVWDERTYNENPSIYISEIEMRKFVDEFICTWGTLLAEEI